MIWVHFCVYTRPNPGRAGQQMKLNSTKNTRERVRMMYFSAESEFTFRQLM